MKKILFLAILLSFFRASAQNSVTEVLSFFNNFAQPLADSSGTVIRTKFPFSSMYYMPTVKIEGYNYGSRESVDLTINWYIYPNSSGQSVFITSNVVNGGGFAPVVQLFNDNGFVSIYLRRGSTNQYCLSFRVRAWMRLAGDGGSNSSWFTGWSAETVNAPPAGNNHVTVPYTSRLENIVSATDANINGIRIGIGKGISNISFGPGSFSQVSTGHNNSALGLNALTKVTNGEYNTAMGAYSLLETRGGSRSVAVGFEALRSYGFSSVMVPANNTAVGFKALRGNNAEVQKNTGTLNTAIGYESLVSNESGNSNTVVGAIALHKNRRGLSNVAIGNSALQESVAGNYNVAVGFQSQVYGNNDTLSSNTYNTSVGAFALSGTTVASANTGLYNTAVGAYALSNNSSGSQQGAIGMHALRYSSGNYNIAFGNSTGLDVLTGSSNVLIGYNTGRGIVSGSGNTIIGASITGLPATLSNTVILGSAGVERLRINSAGGVGIGTAAIPADAKLAVAGSIIADKILVKKSTGGAWPDYVFEEDYRLPDLGELSAFLKKNKHLPEIPSAGEVEAEGQDLGEMNRLLLKKIEELTLYLIHEHQSVAELKKELEAIKKELKNK